VKAVVFRLQPLRGLPQQLGRHKHGRPNQLFLLLLSSSSSLLLLLLLFPLVINIIIFIVVIIIVIIAVIIIFIAITITIMMIRSYLKLTGAAWRFELVHARLPLGITPLSTNTEAKKT
jgi:glucan phosphoethanolaminetransferase (alkaline phosphatase superfamily)